jgi:ABC-type Fe3+/spermidine/putrescine transport system ATPase subunit
MRLEVDVGATFTAEGAVSFTVDAAFDVEEQETLVVLGPSGSGKTLLLETVAGFHDHEGRVAFDGRELGGVPPERRGFGFVFQDYALFPHMTVRENVQYGARYHEETRDPDVLLAELGVGDLVERYPPTLSGGEKQRVALARALAIQPNVLLLDEPLAALDVPTRQALREDLADVLADVTALYVTHNRTTARALADRVVVMREGQVVQAGTTEAVFERPTSPMVASFTGANAVALSDAPSLRALLNGDGAATEDSASGSESARKGTDAGDADGHVAVRPEAITIDEVEGDVRATVERVVREDATSRVTLSLDDVTVDAFADRPPAVGEDVWVSVPSGRIHRC